MATFRMQATRIQTLDVCYEGNTKEAAMRSLQQDMDNGDFDDTPFDSWVITEVYIPTAQELIDDFDISDL